MAGPLTEKPKRGRPKQDGPSPQWLARREEIIETAARVFGERGYDQGSLDDVAAELGTGRASLYHYIDDKAHLLSLIFDRAISATLARMDVLSAIDDPSERLAALIEHQVRTIVAQQPMFAVFFGNRPALDGQYERDIVAKERRLLRYLIEAVQAAHDDGAIDVPDPRLAAQAILGLSSWTYNWFDPARDSVDELVAACQALVLPTSRAV
ncbi:MAG: TetR/AcrR family transcriptional regulator [Actinomycetota bacterium]